MIEWWKTKLEICLVECMQGPALKLHSVDHSQWCLLSQILINGPSQLFECIRLSHIFRDVIYDDVIIIGEFLNFVNLHFFECTWTTLYESGFFKFSRLVFWEILPFSMLILLESFKFNEDLQSWVVHIIENERGLIVFTLYSEIRC